MTSLVLVSLALSAFLCQISQISPCNVKTVSTNSGTVRGKSVTTWGGRQVCSFTAIPYAKHPTGHLRFAPPVPVDSWEGVLDATKSPPSCPQLQESTNAVIGQEDCLFLNIFTPKCPTGHERSARNFPVLFFIHGGQYDFDGISENEYDPYFLLDKELILVVINYRLGALGFLTTGDDVVPGNWGIKDMMLAVKWVYANIEYFGGDRTKITTMGESKGAVAAQLLFYIPEIREYLKRGFSISETILDVYALAPRINVTTPSRKVAKLVECPTRPSEALLRCMRTVPFEKIIQHELQVQPNEFTLEFQDALWAPVIESKSAAHPAITYDVTRPPHQPRFTWAAVLNLFEGGVYVSSIFGASTCYQKNLKKNPELVLPRILQMDLIFCKKDIPPIIRRIINFYSNLFKYLPKSRIRTELELASLTSDWFNNLSTRHALLKHNGTAYLIRSNITQSVSYNMIRSGNVTVAPTHTDFLLNFFQNRDQFPDRTYTKNNIENIKNIVSLIYAFLEYGNPSRGTGIRWEPLENNGKVRFLDMANTEYVLRENFNPVGVQFLDRLMQEYETKDPLTQYEKC